MDKKREGSSKRKEIHLNYTYFGLIFLILGTIHGWSVVLASPEMSSLTGLFVVVAIVQAACESLVLAYISAILHHFQSKIWETLFIVLTGVLCLIHFVDFHLVRLMDMSIWYAVGFILDESWHHFIELLKASTVPFSKIFIGLGIVCLMLIGAIWCFTRTQRAMIKKKKAATWFYKPMIFLGIGCLFIGILEFVLKTQMPAKEYEHYTKALPYKKVLFGSDRAQNLPCSLKSAPSPEEIDREIAVTCGPFVAKPNIFLFVVETLREGFLDGVTAPHLTQFKNSIFSRNYASANATQISWYSIFYAQAPLYFGDMYHSTWDQGSPLLAAFKKQGYKIHLYTGSRLNYYRMNEIIFGKNYALADDVYLDFPTTTRKGWECDLAAVGHLCEDMKRWKDEEGHLYITFIDSTHFSYSWPSETSSLFTPYPSYINFFKAACLKTDLEGIKNRYRNTIHFVDELMGKAIDTMKDTDIFGRSVIVFTADHGEEFFEEGNLFHGSGLSEEQITVPMYFSVPGRERKTHFVSHVDIMPTLLDVCLGKPLDVKALYGRSVLEERQDSAVLSGRFNAGRNPHEFVLQNKKARLHARFDNPVCPEASKHIEILSFTKEGKNQNVVSVPMLMEVFGEAFTTLFTY